MEGLTRCVECNHEGLEETRQPRSRTLAGRTFQVELPAQTCPACGTSYYSNEMVAAYEMSLAIWLARHGINDGGAFRLMRSVLGLKGLELAGLLDVAPETLCRWEKGHRPPDRKATALLASMVLDRAEGHDRTLKRLRSLQEEPSPQDVVNLELVFSAA